MSKVAILQVSDTGPLESIVVMLRHAGYECRLPDDKLRRALRDAGCDTVLDIDGLVRGWGYERPFDMPEATVKDMDRAELYVDVKGHRNGPRVWRRWPRLQGRTLWYRINGGEPTHVIRGGTACHLCDGSGLQWHGTEKDPGPNSPMRQSQCAMCGGLGRIGVEDCGDEVNPPCPVLTPNLWYRCDCGNTGTVFHAPHNRMEECPWCHGRFYAMWPPFHRFHDYLDRHGRGNRYAPPVCLIHRVDGWGYDALVPNMREMGVRIYGTGSPDGLIPHQRIPLMLSTALCMVHLKSSDAPGYALYEALAAACPLVVTRRLIWRNRMQELFEPGVTCLVFDRETHDAMSDADVAECTREVRDALERLRDPAENRRIGMAGRERLKSLMWDAERDGKSLRDFMARCFPS